MSYQLNINEILTNLFQAQGERRVFLKIYVENN